MAYNPASFRNINPVTITEEQIEELVNADDWPYWENPDLSDEERKRKRRTHIRSGSYWILRGESDFWAGLPASPYEDEQPPADPDARRRAQLREEMQGRAARDRRQRGT